MSGVQAIELAWSRAPGGESCIESRELGDKVAAVVGRRAFVEAGQGTMAVVGTIGPASIGSGWIAVVEARSGDATATRRELRVDGPDCRQLDEAIVLVVALMVDSSEPQPPPLVIHATRHPGSISIGVNGSIAIGMLPGAAAGVGLASDVTIPPLWPVALWTNAWPASRAVEGGLGGRLGAWTFGAALCPLSMQRRSWALLGCLGGSGGSIYSNGIGLDVSQSQTLAYAQAELRAGLRVRLVGPLFAGLDLDGGVPFTRYTYRFAQADGSIHEVFRTAAVVPQGGVRLEVRVP